jgi:hypothetical protein
MLSIDLTRKPLGCTRNNAMNTCMLSNAAIEAGDKQFVLVCR